MDFLENRVGINLADVSVFRGAETPEKSTFSRFALVCMHPNPKLHKCLLQGKIIENNDGKFVADIG
jgi:hypothetical protein